MNVQRKFLSEFSNQFIFWIVVIIFFVAPRIRAKKITDLTFASLEADTHSIHNLIKLVIKNIPSISMLISSHGLFKQI